MADYPKITSFKSAAEFRAHLSDLNLDIDLAKRQAILGVSITNLDDKIASVNPRNSAPFFIFLI